jgi:putative oxidoreductase
MIMMFDKLFAPYADVGELILRLALGFVFIPHGWEKLKDPATFTGFLEQLGVPAPALSARLVALLETGGAALIILGVATRVLALGLVIDMLVAIVTVKIRMARAPFSSTAKAQGWDYEFLLMAGALALVFTGAGRLAIDPYLGL